MLNQSLYAITKDLRACRLYNNYNANMLIRVSAQFKYNASSDNGVLNDNALNGNAFNVTIILSLTLYFIDTKYANL